MSRGRGLDNDFMEALLKEDGQLHSFLELVKSDHTLDLEIRENYINIYYRGGNLVQIGPEKIDDKYKLDFDENYFGKNGEKIEITIDNFPKMKQAMDNYLSKYLKLEREFQQLIVRENNYSSIANSTDYYIADIEYAENDSRSDMIAVKWKSDPVSKKKTVDLELALIEVKYGDESNTLRGNSGIIAHLKKAKEMNIKSLQDEMKMCFNQKRELGLILELKHDIERFKEQPKIDFIFILINHDPASSILKNEIDNIKPEDYPNLNIRFAVSNFMGYGLYEDNIYDLKVFKDKFKDKIYNVKP